MKHAYFILSIIVNPNANTSIFVLRKHSRASSGLFTIGSFSLKEVLSTIGTPVRFLNSHI